MTPEPLAFIATCDLAGLVRGKSFPLEALGRRMGRGVGLAPSNLFLSATGPIQATPFGTQGEVMLVPDPAAAARLPAADAPDVHLLLGDIRTIEGEAWPLCPRSFLRQALAQLQAEFGLELRASFEQELVYTGAVDQPGAPYRALSLCRQGAFGGLLLAAMRASGIEPDSFLAEYGPRQYEVTAGPRPGLRAADEAVLVRELARAHAERLGHRAILAPMFTPDGVGNGTHIHWSLWDANGTATHDAARVHGLSEAAEAFACGLLAALPWLTAVTAPSAPSYYRLRPDRWAPTEADLAGLDRGAAVRVCPVYAGSATPAAEQFNVEFRVADATASPYLALGAVVQAGLEGLRAGRRLTAHAPARLPGSLAEALGHCAASPAAAAALGALHEPYLRFKQAELAGLAGLDEAAICAAYAAIY